MFDYVMFRSITSAPIQVLNGKCNEFKYSNIDFNRKKDGAFYEGYYKGLRIRWSRSLLKIENSLHKAYSGNNYTDFQYSDLKNILFDIEERLKIQLETTSVAKLEFAINIIAPEDATSILTSLLSLKNRHFDIIKKGIHQYGKKVVFTQYDFKIYDKKKEVFLRNPTEQVELQNIIRIELQTKKSQFLPMVKSAKDLLKKDIITEIFTKYIGLFSQIQFNQSTSSLAILNRAQLRSYYAGQNIQFWDSMKELGLNSIKKEKELFKKTQNLVKNNCTRSSVIKESLEKKFEKLINS